MVNPTNQPSHQAGTRARIAPERALAVRVKGFVSGFVKGFDFRKPLTERRM
jgi:hypothetical protein